MGVTLKYVMFLENSSIRVHLNQDVQLRKARLNNLYHLRSFYNFCSHHTVKKDEDLINGVKKE